MEKYNQRTFLLDAGLNPRDYAVLVPVFKTGMHHLHNMMMKADSATEMFQSGVFEGKCHKVGEETCGEGVVSGYREYALHTEEG